MNYQQILNVCVITGGQSVEHEISLISALQAILNLDHNKYHIYLLYLTKNNNLVYHKKLTNIKVYQNETYPKTTNVSLKRIKDKTYLVKGLKKIPIDVVLPIVHGKGVEDGTLSGYLELLKVPYTASSQAASSIAQDKILTKKIIKTLHIPTLSFLTINQEINLNKIDQFINKYQFPLIIKPSTLGSSIGISCANNKEELIYLINQAKIYTSKILIEPKLTNFTEYNIACYKKNTKLIFSLIEEVKTSNEILTFNDKYVDSSVKDKNQNNRIINPNLPKQLTEQIYQYTKLIYQELNFKGVIRIDYLYDLEHQKLFFNEVNTIPGSLAFYLYEDLGISYSSLLDDLIKQAIIDYNIESKYQSSFDTNILNIKKIKK